MATSQKLQLLTDHVVAKQKRRDSLMLRWLQPIYPLSNIPNIIQEAEPFSIWVIKTLVFIS